MREKTEINTDNNYRIHKTRRSEVESVDVVDLGHISEHELEDYNGLKVEDVTDEYSFESFDSGNRLLITENGEFLIVHHAVVPTGPWSSVNKNA